MAKLQPLPIPHTLNRRSIKALRNLYNADPTDRNVHSRIKRAIYQQYRHHGRWDARHVAPPPTRDALATDPPPRALE
jgi:hypothetical protein